MSKYRIEGVIVDTKNATKSYEEATRWNGSNHVSRATGSQWHHQTLHRSRRGRYYVERTSQWQGADPGAEFVSPEEAVRWLMVNEHEVPAELSAEAESVSE